jgi:hypothetical protein
MTDDHFPYVYDRGRWLRDEDPGDGLTLRGVVETVVGFVAMAVCLVAVMMLVLCM